MVAIACDLYTLKVMRWIACVMHTDATGPGTAMFVFVYHVFAHGSVCLFAYEYAEYEGAQGEGAWWLSQVPYSSAGYPWLGIVGIILTFVALCCEALADQQLAGFKEIQRLQKEDPSSPA